MVIAYSTVAIYSTNFGQKTEIDFQMNANELYSVVKPAIIVAMCGQTGLVTSFIEHAIHWTYSFRDCIDL